MGNEPTINTEGGAVIGGNVTATTFVGRDQVIQQARQYAPDALHQLRPIRREFTGRAMEINALIENLRLRGTPGGAINIISIEGMSGIGKTELANFVAHAVAKDFPVAQLFVELGAHSPATLSPAQALLRCLLAFYPDAKLPEDEAALRNLYLSTLQGKRTLIILDDARDDKHIESLLPPPECVAIVTSRRALRTGTPLTLDVLPRTESIRLLLQLCPRIGEQADPLARLCGDLPIALTIAGGYLRQHRAKPVQEYVRDLQQLDRVQRLHNEQVQLEALFDYSYRALSATEQAAWRALSVMPANFDRRAALAVIGAGDAGAGAGAGAGAEALDELVAQNLVLYDEQTERYRWHDLVREFAFACAGAAEIDTAARRHAAHYRDVLYAANARYLEGGEAVAAGLGLFDQERPHIRAGQAWSAQRAKEDEAAARLCSDYAGAGSILDLRQLARERVQWLEAALAAARQLQDRSAESVHLGNLGAAYAGLGEVRKAIEFLEQQLAITREIGNRRGEENTLGNLGAAYADLGEMRKAIEFYEQRLVIAREIGDRRGEGNTLGNLGLAYTDLGQMRTAIEFLDQQLAIAREIGDRRGEGIALGNLGAAYAGLGDLHKAIELYEQRLVIAREIGDRRGEAMSSWNMGLAYAGLGELARAIALMQARVDFEREISHPDAEKHARRVEELRAKFASAG